MGRWGASLWVSVVLFGGAAGRLAAGSSAASGPGSSALPPLLVTAAGSPQRQAAADPRVTRERLVRLSARSEAALAAALRGKAPVVIDLDPFPGEPVAVTVRQAEERDGRLTLAAAVVGDPQGHAVLVLNHGVLIGSLRTAGRDFRIRYLGDGLHAIQEVRPGGFPPETCSGPEVDGLDAPASRSRPAPAALVEDGAFIDLLVLYTQAARVAAGGTVAIESLAALGVAETNQALASSQVIPRLRLVATQEVNYTESASAGTDASRLRQVDGFIDEAHSLRDAEGADLVMLLVDAPWGTTTCGIANMGTPLFAVNDSAAFSVVQHDCVSPNYSFGHELGHNLGLNHARIDSAGIGGTYDDAYGYKDPLGAFRCMMSYIDGCPAFCPRILHYSNPDVSYLGDPTGIAAPALDSADSARALDEFRTVPANYRPTQVYTPCPICSEGDVTPRPGGNQLLTIGDWVQNGRFAVNLDVPAAGSEFARADCAPAPGGNGSLSIADWVQAGRYAAALDPPVAESGPGEPGPLAPLPGEEIVASGSERMPAVVELRPGRTAGAEWVEAAVYLRGGGDEAAVGFSLIFEREVLRFVTAAAGGGAPGATLLVNASRAGDGLVGMGLAVGSGTLAAAASGPAIVVRFAPVAGTLGGETAIEFGDLPVARQVVTATARVVAAEFVDAVVATGPARLAPLTTGSRRRPLAPGAGGDAGR